MSNTKEIVNNITNRKLNDARDSIRQELQQRSYDAIQSIKPEIMKNSFAPETDTSIDEDTDEVTEAKKDYEYSGEMDDLIKKAEKMGIKINRKEKYKKGQKASGPRNWRKHNVEVLQSAIENKSKSVDIWVE